MFEQAFRNIDDVLWKEAGCTTELDYTEQTSWLLFLKYLDGLEQDRAAIAELEGKMRAAAAELEFETAARLRDEIKRLESLDLGLEPNLAGRSLQEAAPRKADGAGKARGKQDWRPKPMGPGGGGYDPKKGRGRGSRRG